MSALWTILPIAIYAVLAFFARRLPPLYRGIISLLLSLFFVVCLNVDHSPHHRFGYVVFALLGGALAIDAWKPSLR